MSAEREVASLRRTDAARAGCSRRLRGIVRDPAVWAWAAVALLAPLPMTEALARL